MILVLILLDDVLFQGYLSWETYDHANREAKYANNGSISKMFFSSLTYVGNIKYMVKMFIRHSTKIV